MRSSRATAVPGAARKRVVTPFEAIGALAAARRPRHRTRAALVRLALALVVIAVAPAAGAGRDSTGGATRAPQFADYPAGAVFRGTPAAPDFKRNPAAERFGTLLREGARRGPNFAGHLRVVE